MNVTFTFSLFCCRWRREDERRDERKGWLSLFIFKDCWDCWNSPWHNIMSVALINKDTSLHLDLECSKGQIKYVNTSVLLFLSTTQRSSLLNQIMLIQSVTTAFLSIFRVKIFYWQLSFLGKKINKTFVRSLVLILNKANFTRTASFLEVRYHVKTLNHLSSSSTDLPCILSTKFSSPIKFSFDSSTFDKVGP